MKMAAVIAFLNARNTRDNVHKYTRVLYSAHCLTGPEATFHDNCLLFQHTNNTNNNNCYNKTGNQSKIAKPENNK